MPGRGDRGDKKKSPKIFTRNDGAAGVYYQIYASQFE